LLAGGVASAAEPFTWTDGIGSGGLEPGNGLWSVPSNWAGDHAPAGGPVGLVFPIQACKSPFPGCPDAEDDVPALEASTLTIGNRIVRVPVAPLEPGELPHPPPPHEPPPATYSLAGSQTLRVHDGIVVETTSEGEGEGLESPGATSIAMPLTLTGPNSWVIGREAGGAGELPGASLYLGGALSGAEPLHVVVGQGDSLALSAPAEVGPVTVEGGGYVAFGSSHGGSALNGTDAEPVTLRGVSMFGAGATGPLDVEGGWAEVGLPPGGGTLAVNGAIALTQGTGLYLDEEPPFGTPAKVRAASAQLGGATLVIGERCPAPGTVFTLVEAAGGVSGTFNDTGGHPIVDGETIEPAPNGCGAGAPGAPLRISYAAGAVTATALAVAKQAPVSGKTPVGGDGTVQQPPSTDVAAYVARADAALRRDLAAATAGRTLRRLLEHGSARVPLFVPAGAALTIRWAASAMASRSRNVLLASAALPLGGPPTRVLDVHLRRGARAAARRMRHATLTVTATIQAPGEAPLTLSRSGRLP
jgi:hypothetical protein